MEDFWFYVAYALYILGALSYVLIVGQTPVLVKHEKTQALIIILWPLVMPAVAIVGLVEWCRKKMA